MRAYRVVQALEEAGLQLRDEGLEAQARLLDEAAQGRKDGGLYLPREAVADDANQRACAPPICTLSGPAVGRVGGISWHTAMAFIQG